MLCVLGNTHESALEDRSLVCPGAPWCSVGAGTGAHDAHILPACDSAGSMKLESWIFGINCASQYQLSRRTVLHKPNPVCVIIPSLSDGQVLFLVRLALLPLLRLLWSRGINPLWRYLLVFAVRAVTLFPLCLLACGFWSLASQRNRPHVSLVILRIWVVPPPPLQTVSKLSASCLYFVLYKGQKTTLGPQT